MKIIKKIEILDFELMVTVEIEKCKDEEHTPNGTIFTDSFSFTDVIEWDLIEKARLKEQRTIELKHELDNVTVEQAIENAITEEYFHEIIEEIYN